MRFTFAIAFGLFAGSVHAQSLSDTFNQTTQYISDKTDDATQYVRQKGTDAEQTIQDNNPVNDQQQSPGQLSLHTNSPAGR